MNFKAKHDPITNRPQYVIAYTVEEGGMWLYTMCDGAVDFTDKFNALYARQDVMALRSFVMTQAHRRMAVMAWNQEA